MDRPPPPPIALQGDERLLLTQFLDFYRAALLDRAWGLDPDQLGQTHPPTTLSLRRLISHMAYVEYIWFNCRFGGQDMPEPFGPLDWEADWDAEMTVAESWTTDELLAVFDAAVADSRQRTDAAGSLDDLSEASNSDGEQWNLRWILIHMIEEYARHCGHADLIREAVDGDVVGDEYG